jgi:hypothetical protein
MLLQNGRAAGRERGAVPDSFAAAGQGAFAGPGPDAGLLDMIGDVAGERALILGRGALDLMCALIKCGAAGVTELCRDSRPERASADLVVVPDLATPVVLGHARRALGGAGRVVVRFRNDPSGRLVLGTSRDLRLHGFSTLRQRRFGVQTLVTAELPLFGPLGRA